MASYLVTEEIKITRQAGDDCDVVFTIPDALSLVGASAKFRVKSHRGTVILNKYSGSGLTITDQTIKVSIISGETKNKEGVHRWELEIIQSDLKIITVGKGNFELVNELINE